MKILRMSAFVDLYRNVQIEYVVTGEDAVTRTLRFTYDQPELLADHIDKLRLVAEALERDRKEVA